MRVGFPSVMKGRRTMLKSVLLVGAAMLIAVPAQAGGHMGGSGTSSSGGATSLGTGLTARVGLGAKVGTISNTADGVRAQANAVVRLGGGIRSQGIRIRSGLNTGLTSSVHGLGTTGLGVGAKLGVGLAGNVHGLGTGGRLLSVKVGNAGIGNSLASVKVGTAGVGRLAT